MAKSLLCVEKIANRAARPGLEALVVIIDTARTTKKTELLASNTASRNLQLTSEKSSFARDKNIRDGSANVPTNVFRPLASDLVMMSSLPAA